MSYIIVTARLQIFSNSLILRFTMTDIAISAIRKLSAFVHFLVMHPIG